MIHRLLAALLRAFLRPTYVETKPRPEQLAPPDWTRAPREPHRVKVCRQHAPTEHPLVGSRTSVSLDPARPHVVTHDGLLLQRAEVDLLLADGRMSRLGVLAAYDPVTHEPRRISYVPIHALTTSEVVP